MNAAGGCLGIGAGGNASGGAGGTPGMVDKPEPVSFKPRVIHTTDLGADTDDNIVGEGKDSPGSELIIASVDKDDPRPVWATCWGGCNTIAQALWKVQITRAEGVAR